MASVQQHQLAGSGDAGRGAVAIPKAHVSVDRAAIVVETVPIPIALVADDLTLDAANRAFYEFFALHENDAAGMSILELHPDFDVRMEVEAALCDAFDSGRPVAELEFEYPSARLGPRTIAVHGRHLPSQTGEHALMLVLEDITDRRRRDEAVVRAREARAQRFLNEAGRLLLAEPLESGRTLEKLARMAVPQLGDLCLIDLVDEDRSIRAVAAHASGDSNLLARVVGRIALDAESTPAAVVRTGLSVIHGDLHGAALRQLEPRRAEVLRALGARSYLCVPLAGRRGVLGALSLARLAQGQRFAMEDLVLAEGLGQRAGLAIENAQLYRAAYDAIRLREEFLAIAAHELRTPLTALRLQLESAEALLSNTLDGEAERAQHKIARSLVHGERLARLIDSLLVVSRILRGVLPLQREQLDLSELVRDVVERLGPEAQRAGCDLRIEAGGTVDGYWDPARLEQVVTNLVSNALRFAPGAPVTCRVEADGDVARIEVLDGGPGIPEERRARIFERFEIAGERSTSGLGLGLYITRQIAEAHGGSVRLASEPGRGSRFVVELPRALRDSPLPPPR